MTIEEIFSQIYPLPPDAIARLQVCIREIRLPKGHLLLQTNRVEHRLFFIKKGIVRAFSHCPEKDLTFWFGEEGDAVISMRSYVEHKRSYENIELLEDCELFELDTLKLDRLYQENIHLANWGRRLAETELLKTETRWLDFDYLSAKDRYDKLIAEKPSLLHRVPLKYVASYLGMTQVSLSRIRKLK